MRDSHNSSVKRYSFGKPTPVRRFRIAVLFAKAEISSGKLNTAQSMELRKVIYSQHILDNALKAAFENILPILCALPITFSSKPQNHRPQHVGDPLLVSEGFYNQHSQNLGLNVPPVGATVHSRAPQTHFQQSHKVCNDLKRST